MMNRKLQTGLLALCLFLPCGGTLLRSQVAQQQQQPPASPPAAPPSSAPVPQAQRETPLNTSDAQISLQLFYWLDFSAPDLHGGKANVGPYPGELKYPGRAKPAPGAVVSIPAGRNNTIRVSYFRVQGDGNASANANLTLFNTDFAPGDYLVTRYTLQNVKISYDFLSYPYPADPARFRLKTLWEVQYTTIQSSIDAPLKTVQVDASGNPISNTATGSRRLIYPSLGLAIEKALTPHFRVEARASGFAFPHRATIWDADASAVFRTGPYEVAAGVKAFHFKTSPQNPQYFAATFPGAYVAIRYYPKRWW
jgi:hypothetical protein